MPNFVKLATALQLETRLRSEIAQRHKMDDNPTSFVSVVNRILYKLEAYQDEWDATTSLSGAPKFVPAVLCSGSSLTWVREGLQLSKLADPLKCEAGPMRQRYLELQGRHSAAIWK